MIQFNLLPDVKLEYIKANRIKRTVTIISLLATAAALFVFILMILSVDVVQKNHEKNLNNQITTLSNKLTGIPNINGVLTVQDEVNALPSLYQQNPVATRLPGYLSEITPATVTISSLGVNFGTGTVNLTGAAPDLATVNQFVDILKLSSYQTSSSTTPKNAFTDVVLSSFAYASGSGATYTITATFDPAIFNSSQTNVALSVPSGITSHSTTSQAGVLFDSQSPTSSNSSGQ